MFAERQSRIALRDLPATVFYQREEGRFTMDRRQFCRSALASSAALSYPLLQACERSGRAGPGIPALTLDGKQIELERRAVDDLAGRFSGRLLLSDHADYDKARAIWN